MRWGGGEARRRETQEATLRHDLERLEKRRNTVAELQAGLLEDQALLSRTLAALQPGLPWEEAADRVRQICYRRFELTALLMVRMDWAGGWLHLPYLYEVSRVRQEPPRLLEEHPGLSGRVLLSGASLYCATKEETFAAGAVLTEAEKNTGLHSQSWFGVPLRGRDPLRPVGAMAFQAFHPHAFPENRRRLMEALAGLTALHLG